jgi:hypothetical protein
MIAAQLRKRRPKPHATWYLDEVYLKIDGRMAYLWRAIDAEGEVLDVLVQSKRNKHAALKLMRKLLKKSMPSSPNGWSRTTCDHMARRPGGRGTTRQRRAPRPRRAPGQDILREVRGEPPWAGLRSLVFG